MSIVNQNLIFQRMNQTKKFINLSARCNHPGCTIGNIQEDAGETIAECKENT